MRHAVASYQSSMSRRRAESDGGDLSLPSIATTSDVSAGSCSAGTWRRPRVSRCAEIRSASPTSSAVGGSVRSVAGGVPPDA